MKISYFGTLWSCVRVRETHTGLMFSNMCSVSVYGKHIQGDVCEHVFHEQNGL
jgi:hypothetical protein